jgi:hypothetical protein
MRDEIAESIQFSHPVEQAFAQILDFYGTPWEYEPKTFPLEWDETGNVTTAFSPDFYLPGEDMYIEITTLRPKLNRIKNKKMRLMAEHYPDVRIKLFKRSDVRNLMIKFGLYREAERIFGTDAQPKAYGQ